MSSFLKTSALSVSVSVILLLMMMHFVYSIYVKHRKVATTVTFQIQNESHFQIMSVIQVITFLLFIASSTITATATTIPPSTCSIAFYVASCCWFIGRYLCGIHFLFRQHVIGKMLSLKWSSWSLWLCGMLTVTESALLTLYALNHGSDSRSLFVSATDSEAVRGCGHWTIPNDDHRSNLLALSLNLVDIALLSLMWSLTLRTSRFLKSHRVLSVFATSNALERTQWLCVQCLFVDVILHREYVHHCFAFECPPKSQ